MKAHRKSHNGARQFSVDLPPASTALYYTGKLVGLAGIEHANFSSGEQYA